MQGNVTIRWDIYRDLIINNAKEYSIRAGNEVSEAKATIERLKDEYSKLNWFQKKMSNYLWAIDSAESRMQDHLHTMERVRNFHANMVKNTNDPPISACIPIDDYLKLVKREYFVTRSRWMNSVV